MHPRFLRYYNRELDYIREMGAEFAEEFPKIAERLGLKGAGHPDPYVERLFEGLGFLAARIQLKLDAEFPRFTQQLIELIYPQYLAPTPSMALVRLQPKLEEAGLADGRALVPRGAALRSMPLEKGGTPCEYRTAHAVTLWPLVLDEARYFASAGALADQGITGLDGVRAGIRLSFEATAGLAMHSLALDQLPLYVTDTGERARLIYEQLMADCVGVVLRPGEDEHRRRDATTRLAPDAVRRKGFAEDEALLPYGRRAFSGYRLLHEYFAFPQRFRFVEFAGLAPALSRCPGPRLEVTVLLSRAVPALERELDASHFALHCTPAINLFERRADRIHLDPKRFEYPVVPGRPSDFEVHSITEVTGFGASTEPEQTFLPFYASFAMPRDSRNGAYFTVSREPRKLSSRQKREQSTSAYVGSEVYLSLVDGNEAPFSSRLRRLAVNTLCTNRDMPVSLSKLMGRPDTQTDFSLETGAPVDNVRCLSGPTPPRHSFPRGETAWRLVSHLSLNYLSLIEGSPAEGARALRELLSLYADPDDRAMMRQIEGVREVQGASIIRRVPVDGPITFGRGKQLTVTCEEEAFEGTGVFLLGAVLEEFFRRYVHINSFTETVLRTNTRGEVMRWPARLGKTHLI